MGIFTEHQVWIIEAEGSLYLNIHAGTICFTNVYWNALTFFDKISAEKFLTFLQKLPGTDYKNLKIGSYYT